MKTLIKNIDTQCSTGQIITVEGWVRTIRNSKEFSFITLNDGSNTKGVQIVITKELNNYDEIAALCTGASLKISGSLVDSPGNKQKYEIQAQDVVLYGNVGEGYKIQPKPMTLDTLREMPTMRVRTNIFGAVFRLRNAVAFAIHEFFQKNNFLYVHTPIITASDTEGAGEMFRVTTLDLNNIPKKDGAVDVSQDFFSADTKLTVSGQLNVETFCCSLGNVYTFGPCFRAENSNTTRHLAEFWMIEPEIAFGDIVDDMNLAESFVKYIIQYCFDHNREDIEFLTEKQDPELMSRLQNTLENKFERITYTEAVEILTKQAKGVSFEFPVSWGTDLASEHEKYLTEQHFKKPVIVTDYPKDIKAFYMKLNADGKTVRAMDVLCPGIGEIIGGSQREEVYDKLVDRIKSMGLDPHEYEWYLDLRRHGTIPHAGFGLGFERMMMYITGMGNIRDVIPFPRYPRHAEY